MNFSVSLGGGGGGGGERQERSRQNSAPQAQIHAHPEFQRSRDDHGIISATSSSPHTGRIVFTSNLGLGRMATGRNGGHPMAIRIGSGPAGLSSFSRVDSSPSMAIRPSTLYSTSSERPMTPGRHGGSSATPGYGHSQSPSSPRLTRHRSELLMIPSPLLESSPNFSIHSSSRSQFHYNKTNEFRSDSLHAGASSGLTPSAAHVTFLLRQPSHSEPSTPASSPASSPPHQERHPTAESVLGDHRHSHAPSQTATSSSGYSSYSRRQASLYSGSVSAPLTSQNENQHIVHLPGSHIRVTYRPGTSASIVTTGNTIQTTTTTPTSHPERFVEMRTPPSRPTPSTPTEAYPLTSGAPGASQVQTPPNLPPRHSPQPTGVPVQESPTTPSPRRPSTSEGRSRSNSRAGPVRPAPPPPPPPKTSATSPTTAPPGRPGDLTIPHAPHAHHPHSPNSAQATPQTPQPTTPHFQQPQQNAQTSLTPTRPPPPAGWRTHDDGGGGGGYIQHALALEQSKKFDLRRRQRERLNALQAEVARLQAKLPELRDQVTTTKLSPADHSEISSGLPEKIRQLLEQNCTLLVDCSFLQIQANLEETRQQQEEQQRLQTIQFSGQENTRAILDRVPPPPTEHVALPGGGASGLLTSPSLPGVQVTAEQTLQGATDSGSSQDEKWTCPKCTFANSPLLPRCEMCELPRRDPPQVRPYIGNESSAPCYCHGCYDCDQNTADPQSSTTDVQAPRITKISPLPPHEFLAAQFHPPPTSGDPL